MSARLAIAAGLVTGVAAAVALLVGLATVVPDPGAPSAPPTVPLVAASASALTTFPAESAPATPAASTGTQPTAGAGSFDGGVEAPPLDVEQVGGGSIALAELRGKPVWVTFMTTSCGPCGDAFPLMNDFAARYADQGLVVIAVNVGEDEGTVAAFAERLNTSLPIGLDADGSARHAWGAETLPAHYWIDLDGVIRDAASGAIGAGEMAESLQAIMPGVEVTP